MEDDVSIGDGLAIEVPQHRDFNMRRRRRRLVFTAVRVIVLGEESERTTGKANTGHESANPKMRTLEHADILSRSKVWSEAANPESVTLSQDRPPEAAQTTCADERCLRAAHHGMGKASEDETGM